MRAAAGSLLALLSLAAAAGDLTVTVRDGDGRPVADAVVVLDGGPPHAPAARPPRAQIHQRNQAFVPQVLAVRVGTVVEFPNDDPVLHHVYSFSPAKTFDLRLYGQAEVPTVIFDKPGVVALGCNIHDSMRGYVYVTESPLHAVTDASGTARFNALPEGEYSLSAWHARLKDGALPPPIQFSQPTADNEAIEFTVSLRRSRAGELDEHERGNYR